MATKEIVSSIGKAYYLNNYKAILIEITSDLASSCAPATI